MNDETRKLLKLFGVAVTDFEAEAEKLAMAAGQLSGNTGKDQIVALLKDTTDLCRELNIRWLETAQHMFAIQNRLLSRIAEAAGRLQATESQSK
jgi:NAD+--asparagine ADP-ribosyltransferase